MPDRAGPQPVLWALFSLKGRIRRATYGLGVTLLFSLWWVAMAQMFAAGEGTEGFDSWALVLGLIMIVSGYCVYALAHKRMHDLGYPGWYALGISFAGFFFLPLMALALIGLGFAKGQAETNQFGPPPVQ